MANNKPVNFFVGRCTKAVSIFLLSSFTLCYLLFVSLFDFVSYPSLFALGTLKIKADSTPQRTVSQEKKNLTPLFLQSFVQILPNSFGFSQAWLIKLSDKHKTIIIALFICSHLPEFSPGDLFKNNTLLFAFVFSNIYLCIWAKRQGESVQFMFSLKPCCKKRKNDGDGP